MYKCTFCALLSPTPTCGECGLEGAIPQRRFQLELHLGADTWEGMLNALEQILQDFEIEGQVANRVSGGASSGHWHTLIEHPDVTPESYRAAIEANRAYRLKHGEALK